MASLVRKHTERILSFHTLSSSQLKFTIKTLTDRPAVQLRGILNLNRWTVKTNLWRKGLAGLESWGLWKGTWNIPWMVGAFHFTWFQPSSLSTLTHTFLPKNSRRNNNKSTARSQEVLKEQSDKRWSMTDRCLRVWRHQDDLYVLGNGLEILHLR